MNSMKGAIAFDAGGQSYSLRLSTNAQVRYQDASGQTLLTSLAALKEDPTDMRRLRQLFWAGLSDTDGIDEDAAGEIMDDIGFMEAARLFSLAAQAAFPDVSEDSPGNVPGAKAPKKTR